jgi:hypothetical protein
LSTTGTSSLESSPAGRVLGAAGADLDDVDARFEERIEVPEVDELAHNREAGLLLHRRRDFEALL